MFVEAARLIREMDEMFADDRIDPRSKVFRAFQFSNRVSAAIRHYCVQHDWKLSPWPKIKEVLGSDPLRHESKINDILDSLASGAIPDWCLAWCRVGKPS